MGALQWSRTTALNMNTSNSAIAPLETSVKLDSNKARKDFKCVSAYQFYQYARQKEIPGWCEWHLNIDENDNVIEIAKKFHQNFQKLESTSSIRDKIDTINQTFLQFKPNDKEWNKIRDIFKEARKNNDPSLVVKAYTVSQVFSSSINNDSAANTYHALKLYCTLLNCPILARTQEYTEAITSIFFHPQLNKRIVREETVYRGIVLPNKDLVANYKEGATIITTTFLSTTMNYALVDSWSANSNNDKISIICTYNISNRNRCTAIDVSDFSKFPDEKEILILRYVPFIITSLRWENNGKKMIICFNECDDNENYSNAGVFYISTF